MTRKPETFTMTVLLMAVYCGPVLGQAPASTLKIELRNVVEYQVDTSDLSKFGTDPNLTVGSFTAAAGCLGHQIISIGDVVSVNGQAAKGAYVSRAVAICLSPTPIAGQPLADTTRSSIRYETIEILQSDGTPIGTLMTEGLNSGGPSPPGPPAGSFNFAIVGGTGAFLGAANVGQNVFRGAVDAPLVERLHDAFARRRGDPQIAVGHVQHPPQSIEAASII